jgi:pimeloyl-ACP methyl ester carboxylesterase
MNTEMKTWTNILSDGGRFLILPAEHPDHQRCGDIPSSVPGLEEVPVNTLHYPRMTWYDDADLTEAERQILALGAVPLILIGFSKSGPGALRLALLRPERVAGLVLFDFPTPSLTPAMNDLCPHEHSNSDNATRIVAALKIRLSPSCQILIISGNTFAAETSAFASLLVRHDVPNHFRARPAAAHRWDSGWLEEIAGLRNTTLPETESGRCE